MLTKLLWVTLSFSTSVYVWTISELIPGFLLTAQSLQTLLKLRSKMWRHVQSPSGGPWDLMETAPSRAMTLNAKINQVSPWFPPTSFPLQKALLFFAFLMDFTCKKNLDSWKLRGGSFYQFVSFLVRSTPTFPVVGVVFCRDGFIGSALPLFSMWLLPVATLALSPPMASWAAADPTWPLSLFFLPPWLPFASLMSESLSTSCVQCLWAEPSGGGLRRGPRLLQMGSDTAGPSWMCRDRPGARL